MPPVVNAGAQDSPVAAAESVTRALKDVEDDHGPDPGGYSPEATKKLTLALLDFARVFEKQSREFEEGLVTGNTIPFSEAGLFLVRKKYSEHIDILFSTALNSGVDVTVSCLALYLLNLFATTMLSRNLSELPDPAGLGSTRMHLSEEQGAEAAARIVKLATQAIPPAANGVDDSAVRVQRALATKLLASSMTDDTSLDFVKDATLLKTVSYPVFWRLPPFWLPPRASPRRSTQGRPSSNSRPPPPLTLPSPSSTLAPPPPMSPGAPRESAPSPRIGARAAPDRQNAAAASSPSSSASKRPREEPTAEPTASSSSEAPAPKRRGLAARLQRVQQEARKLPKLVEDSVLFPQGCHSKAPPPVTLRDLETTAIMELIGVLGGHKEILSPALHVGLPNVLIRVFAADVPMKVAVMTYQLAWVMFEYKKFALVFLEAGGLEVMLKGVEQSMSKKWIGMLQVQSAALERLLSKVVLERIAATQSFAPEIIRFCVKMLDWNAGPGQAGRTANPGETPPLGDRTDTVTPPPEAEPEQHAPPPAHGDVEPGPELLYASVSLLSLARENCAAVLILALPIPLYLQHFDENPNSLPAMLNALDSATDAWVLQSPLCLALQQYIKSHFVMSTASIWPTNRKLGNAMKKNLCKTLPIKTAFIETILSHLELPLTSTGPDARRVNKAEALRIPGVVTTGLTLLSRARLPAISRAVDLGVVPVLLKLVRSAHKYVSQAALHNAIEALYILCAVPSLHKMIASCPVEDYDAMCGLGVLLDVFEDQQVHKATVLGTLMCIMRLVTPPFPRPDNAERKQMYPYPEIWELFRAHDGVRVVLNSLDDKDLELGDKFRYVSCRILLSMCAEPALRGMLNALDVPKRLLNAVHEGPISEPKLNQQFKAAAKLVISAALAKDHPSDVVGVPDVDHALLRLQKNFVVQSTDIEFNPSELLSIVHTYLKANGLHRTAAQLKKEGNLAPKEKEGCRPLHELPEIVKSFLRQQHLACPNPITTLPTFSLRKGAQPALRAAVPQLSACRNAAVRVRNRRCGLKPKRTDANDRRFMYSRFKSTIFARGDTSAAITAMGFTADNDHVLVGFSSGMLLRFDTRKYECRRYDHFQEPEEIDLLSLPVTGIRPSLLRDVVSVWSTDRITLHSGSDLAHILVEVDGYRSAMFGNSDAGFAVLTSAERTAAAYYDIETKTVVQTYDDRDRRTDNESNLAITNATDTMLLSDAVLYDVRASSQDHHIHRYDKLNWHSRGVFAPNQYEIIIDKEVWDIRTHRLVRTIPSLASTRMVVSPFGHVIYGAKYEVAALDADEEPHNSIMTVVDGTTYDHICTQDLTDTIEDFTTDSSGLVLGCCLTLNDNNTSYAKLLQVGRSKRIGDSADDSEASEDDELSDDEEDEEDEEEEEEDFEEESNAGETNASSS
ncbi:hypothetical protein DIPPA_22182 [Diplonema papillatum]|nr:hypothetical protein DIPPA_22182 [Diplonema papillatum]